MASLNPSGLTYVPWHFTCPRGKPIDSVPPKDLGIEPDIGIK